MKKKIIWGGGAFVILLLAYNLIFSKGNQSEADIIVSPKKGDFQIDITTSGELEAKSSVKVMGPQILQ